MRILDVQLIDEFHDLGIELVSGLGPPLQRQKPSDAVLLEGMVDLVVSRAGKAVKASCLADG